MNLMNSRYACRGVFSVFDVRLSKDSDEIEFLNSYAMFKEPPGHNGKSDKRDEIAEQKLGSKGPYKPSKIAWMPDIAIHAMMHKYVTLASVRLNLMRERGSGCEPRCLSQGFAEEEKEERGKMEIFDECVVKIREEMVGKTMFKESERHGDYVGWGEKKRGDAEFFGRVDVGEKKL